MGDKTGIEWTDATWNPVTGCDEVSPGCDHCYARTVAERFTGTTAYPDGFAVTLKPERLDQPLRWRRPRRVFVNSMSDLFHASIPTEYIAHVFAVMALAPRHTFQLLTKRHGRMRSLLSSDEFWTAVVAEVGQLRTQHRADPGAVQDALVSISTHRHLPNVWLGVSVEDQKRADLRIPALLDTPAAVRFLSCEPLLGPVHLTDLPWCPHDGGLDLWPGMHNALTGTWHTALGYVGPDGTDRSPGHARIDWVIVGGESGKDARPMHPDWARALRDQCDEAGVPFLFKQWGEWAPTDQALSYSRPHTRGLTGKTPTGGHRAIYLDRNGAERDTNELTTLTLPADWVWVARVNKRNAGRCLDGNLHDGYPEPQQ